MSYYEVDDAIANGAKVTYDTISHKPLSDRCRVVAQARLAGPWCSGVSPFSLCRCQSV